MITVDTLDDSPSQQTSVKLSDGSSVIFTFVFRPRLQRWVLNVSDNSTFTANGLMLCVHPNLLRSFRRVIPFGLAVVSTDGADPFTLQDFSTGRISLYVLDNTTTNTDVTYVEENIFLGTL